MALWERLSQEELQRLLDHSGSWKGFRELLGLSHRDMVRLLQTHTLKFKKLESWTKEYLESELTRIGSSKVFCILHSCKESELRSRLKSLNMDLKTLSSPHASTIGIGRKGELFYKEVRFDHASLEDMFETEGHSAPYDIRDGFYGRVNVKTANVNRFKAKTRANDPNYWHFSTKGWENCDYLAFVPLSPDGSASMVIMAKAQDIGRLFPTHVVMTGKDIRPASPALSRVRLMEFSLFPDRLLTSLKQQNINSQGLENWCLDSEHDFDADGHCTKCPKVIMTVHPETATGR
jgi:hypothetical protein